MNPASRWSIHIASRDHAAMLFEALRSIDGQTVTDKQVICIDQAVASESGRRLLEERPDVIVLRNFRDKGYVRAHNQAVAFALSRWPKEALDDRFVLFLHPDVVLEPSAVEKMQQAFETDESLMIAGPKILKANLTLDERENREVELTDTIETVGWRLDRQGRIKERGAGEQDRGQYDQGEEDLAPAFACFAMRASALLRAETKGSWLDEDLPERLAIVDLIWRCRWLGMRCKSIPQAVAWHQGHNDKRQKRMDQILMYLVEIKNEAFTNFLRRLWSIAWATCRAKCAALVHGSMFAAGWRSLALIPKKVKERRALQKRRAVFPKTMRQWFI